MAGTPTWWEAFVRDVCKRWDGCESTDLSGLPALMVHGNDFVALAGYDILVRLDEFSRARALAKPMARELTADDIVTAPKGWVLLTVPSSAAERFSEEWAKAAYRFVAALPPRRRPKEPEEKPRKGKKKARAAAKKRAAKRPARKPVKRK